MEKSLKSSKEDKLLKTHLSDLKYSYGWKVKIHPSSKQKQIIKINSDASRFVYNELVGKNKRIMGAKQYAIELSAPYFLTNQISAMYTYLHKVWWFKKQGKPVNVVVTRYDRMELARVFADIEDMKKSISLVTEIRKRHEFLNNKLVDSCALSSAQQQYKAAWNMFRKVHQSGVPNFKHKSYNLSYKSCNIGTSYDFGLDHKGSFRFTDKDHAKLPKIGTVRVDHMHMMFNKMKDHRVRLGSPAIKCDSVGDYWLSFTMASNEPFKETKLPKNTPIGIDLNTENLYMDSDGNRVDNPRFYRNSLKQLGKQQRKLSRRRDRAKKEKRNLRFQAHNYQKQRVLVAKLARKVRNQRNYFLNVVSTELVKKHDRVFIEDLMGKNMLKNHALAMSISDVGWRTFVSQLTYKEEMFGGEVVKVDPKNTTQACSSCGFLMGTEDTQKLTLKDREWTCPKCGEHHIRDVNAAKNIMALGLSE